MVYDLVHYIFSQGFLGGAIGKEATCNAGDLGSILGLGDPPVKGKTTHSSILAWRIPCTVYSPWGHKDLDTTERLSPYRLP